MRNNLIYDRKLPDNIEEMPSEIRKVLQWVGYNKKVLEVGCHTGNYSKWMQNQGCQITAVEINHHALSKAQVYLNRSISGNIEGDEIWQQVASERYDVITYLQVLEHLVDPWRILNLSIQRLNAGGFVLVGLPNINNFIDRMAIFKGDFDYTDTGVMDKTHLRFFNQKTAVEMFEKSGFEVVDYFSPWQTSIFRSVPILGRFDRLGIKITEKISKNLSDVVMMHKLVPARIQP